MRRKRGLVARDRASGTVSEVPGRPVAPPDEAPARQAPAWAQVSVMPPPGVAQQGQALAGVVRRLLAWGIDLVVLFVLFLPVLWLFEQALGPIATWRGDPVASLLYTDASALVGFCYWVGLWSGGRRTVGMRLLGIAVVDARHGGPLPLGAAVRRWILFEGVTVLLGLASDVGLWTASETLAVVAGTGGMLWGTLLLASTILSPTRQGLHDRFGRSAVIRR